MRGRARMRASAAVPAPRSQPVRIETAEMLNRHAKGLAVMLSDLRGRPANPEGSSTAADGHLPGGRVSFTRPDRPTTVDSIATLTADPDSLMTRAKQVLFVDDDQYLLEGLRDALRPYRHRWRMSFVTTGEAALQALDTDCYDVIVCDLRMPGMDGATVLELARERSPSTVRVVLSGQADIKLVSRAAALSAHADVKLVSRAAAAAHRLVAKPCGTDELTHVIDRSCALHEIATRVELDSRAIGAATLPSVPRAYAQLSELLRRGTASAADIATVINQDIAMAAKVLQLANSAYFGRRQPTTRIVDAVAYLGTDTLRALLLHAEAFHVFCLDTPIPGFDLDRLQRHCTRVAHLAGSILADTGGRGDAFTAGLLHDIGLLVLAAQAPQDLGRILTQAREQSRSIADVERENQVATHAEIGAYLLALWGLPHTITEAVAGHDDPGWLRTTFDAVAAVNIANTLIETLEAKDQARPAPSTEPTRDYLKRLNLASRLDHWQTLAHEVCAEHSQLAG